MGNNIQKWYEMDMPLEEVKRILSANIKTMSRSFIAAGFYMKYIRDNELYKQDGYSSIWEFSQAVYGIQKSTASRWMSMNDKFSKDGNSPVLDNRYKDFNKSQLQEMLYLTDQQIKDADPEMSAKEIRAIRKPEIVAPAQQEDQIPGQDSIDQHPEYMPVKALPIDAPEEQTKKEKGHEPAKCITGKSGSGICGTAAYCDKPYNCCSQCKEDCNIRCGWLPERCFPAVDQEENAAEKQQTDHFVEPNKIDHTGETTEMPWPEELTDIQIPTETEITGYLYDEQRKLKEIEESKRPWMEVYRQQLIVAGLRLIKKLVENQE